MGLDLLVEACAKPGHEDEWRRAIQRSFDGDPASQSDLDRFAEISTPPFERLGAPRVGQDEAANRWILKVRKASTPDEVADILKTFDGYHVVALVESDGVPKYSHAGLYDGVDETSFRGSALKLCGDVLSDELIEHAWEHKLPEQAVSYGEALLAAARAAAAAGAATASPKRRGLFAKLLTKAPDPKEPFEEQLKIVEAAGRWFVFWGERGHAIRAWS